ncbi:hypothetical protein LCGC14_0303480 [marine sediment metagenome]|uniref:HNH nuclease domain-containing protein n=1 Tax=marine sediment metagenome TaxID=412755 RepID=A0A0F9U6X8_9ZZZZ
MMIKPVVGYEGRYSIDHNGNVFSIKYNMMKKLPNKAKDGHLRVRLHKKGKVRTIKISRLVAEAFIPNPDNLKWVRRKNLDNTDDRIENLEWFSPVEKQLPEPAKIAEEIAEEKAYAEHIMTLELKPVVGYEGLYSVDRMGSIYSHRNKMKKRIPSKGRYYRIGLAKNGKSRTFSVARITAEAFIPNPENKPQINHKNLDKHDNRVENLEWCTKFENMAHAMNARQNKVHP